MNKKVALLTGCTGQDGSFLSELLLEKDYVVYGVSRRTANDNLQRIRHILDNPNFHLLYGDVTDMASIMNAIETAQPDEFYNLAAQSVANDVMCPILSAQGIEYRTLEDLWNEQIVKNKTVNKINVNGTETEVISLSDTSQLKALGYWNGTGTFFKIKQISRHYWKDKIAHIKQKFGSIKVTPNHCLLNVKQEKINSKLAENDWLLNVRKLNYEPGVYKDEIELKLSGVYLYDDEYLWLNEEGKIGKVKKVIKGNDLDIFCKFIGFFIAEGCCSYNKANRTYTTIVSNCNKKYLEDLKEELKSFLDCNMCISVCKKENYNDCYNLQIKSRAFYNLMKKICGDKCYCKKLPKWFPFLRKEKLRIILDNMIFRDGCYTSWDTIRYGTVSYELACQLGLVFSILDIDYTVIDEYSTKDEIRNIYTKCWHFRECRTYQPNQGEEGRKVEYLDYDGYVYDISVEEVENFAIGVGNIVVHNSFVGESWNQPLLTFDATAKGCLNCLEALRIIKKDTKFYQASSSEMFGKVLETPQKETTLFNPRSPYGVAKCAAHYATKNYRESYGMFCCNGILHNHESQRRGHEFVTRKISMGVAKIYREMALETPIEEITKIRLGNLDAKRDWGHAKDFVKAMFLMLQQDEPDDYVIATGETHTVEDFLREAFLVIGIENWRDYVVQDPKFMRPAEVDLLLGDPSKAKQKLGWEPEIKFKELVKLMVKSDL